MAVLLVAVIDSESSDEDVVEHTPAKTKPPSKSKAKSQKSASSSKKSSASAEATPTTVSTLSEESTVHESDTLTVEGDYGDSDDESTQGVSESGRSSPKSSVRGRPSASAAQEIKDLKKQINNEKMVKSKETKALERKLKDVKALLATAEEERDTAMQDYSDLDKAHKTLLAKHKAAMARLASTKSPTSAKNEGMVMQTKKMTKGDLWRLVKFIGTNTQLRKASKMVLVYLNLKDYTVMDGDSAETKQEVALAVEEWLTLYSTDVRQANNEQRSYVQSEMKKIALAWLKNGNTLPKPDVFLRIAQRGVENTKEDQSFFDLYVLMVSAVAGSSTYGEKQRRTETISSCKTQDKRQAVTVSTEALVMVMYENCHQKWLNMHDYKEVQKKSGNIPKYSSLKHELTKKWKAKYSDSCSGNSPYGGWSKEGIAKFNSYSKLFRTLHQELSEEQHQVEEEAVARFAAVYEEERKRKRAENGLEEDPGAAGESSVRKKARIEDDDDAVLADFDEDD